MERFFAKPLCLQSKLQTVRAGSYHAVLLTKNGSATAQWEGGGTLCGSDTLLIMKPGSKVLLTPRSAQGFNGILIGLSPALLLELSVATLSVEACFNVAPYACMGVTAPSESAHLIKNLAAELINAKENSKRFAQQIYEHGVLELFTVLVLRVCIARERQNALYGKKHFLIDDVFIYIKRHLTENITLALLAKEFYVSREHIAREFKKHTGQTVHNYLLRGRLELCRQYICNGRRAADFYHLCGFSSCASMIRAFKAEYGITPLAYYKLCEERAKSYPGI